MPILVLRGCVMKLFITFFAVSVFGFFLWLLFNYFSIFGSVSGYLPEESDEENVFVEENFVENDSAEIFIPETIQNTDTEIKEEEEEKKEEDDSPVSVITLPGGIIERGDFAFYNNYQNHILRLRMLNVSQASSGLTAQVKSDIPEASAYKIWRVVFEQSLYSGINVYGTIAELNSFSVKTLNGEPAYLLSSTGDYAGCEVNPLFQEDFEDFTPYSQCFIVASNVEPVLLFIGEIGSEYNVEPIVLK